MDPPPPLPIPLTSEVPFVSSVHGRMRREERGITRGDLQAAVLHGTKESAGRDLRTGAQTWKYRYRGICYVTDDSATFEITSYREVRPASVSTEQKRSCEKAKRRLERDPSLCTSHSIIVVDHSGSMKTSEVRGFQSGVQAVFGMLALNFVKHRLSRNEASSDTDVVSLVLMHSTAIVAFEREPMGVELYNKFVDLHDRSGDAFSPGNYESALHKVEELFTRNCHSRSCALGLLFFAAGQPIHELKATSPEASKDAPGFLGWSRVRNGQYTLAKSAAATRVRALAETFKGQLSVSAIGFANHDQDLGVLESIARVAQSGGAKGFFHRAMLSADGLRQSIAQSISSIMSIKNCRNTTAQSNNNLHPIELRQVERESTWSAWGETPTTWDMGGWFVYTEGVERVEYLPSAGGNGKGPWVSAGFGHGKANCIAIRRKALGEGPEHVVFGLQASQC